MTCAECPHPTRCTRRSIRVASRAQQAVEVRTAERLPIRTLVRYPDQPTRGDRDSENPLYTLTINGRPEPADHQTLAAAALSLWQHLDALDLDTAARNAYRRFLLSDGMDDRLADFIDRDGRFELRVATPTRRLLILITPTPQARATGGRPSGPTST